METVTKKEKRRKFLGVALTTFLGALFLGGKKKAVASSGQINHKGETLYRRTKHVEEYFQTLD